jgi:N4-gp56 family major capsid protein
MDQVCADVAYAGTTVAYVDQTARASLVAGNTITSSEIRQGVASLRGGSAPTIGANYIGIIHPDVAYDLVEQTGTADLRSFQIRGDHENVRAGEIGTFDGVTFIQSPRALLVTDGGASTVDAYGTLLLGAGGIGKATSSMFGEEPEVVFGPVTDSLRRFQPVGWYAMCGYGIIRQDALYRIESSSSIGTN